MKRSTAGWMAAVLALVVFGGGALAQLTHVPLEPDETGELPKIDRVLADNSDFVRREAMIPMRDGVKLFTIILIPRTQEQMPILLSRTPYSASKRSTRDQSQNLEAVLPGGDDVIANAGYIRVFQDVRGKYRSEGDYVMNRPLRGQLNPTGVDHSTDAYDTIEWLINNVPESNQRVGMIGTSYDGFLVLMALINPHPALKAAVPVNPMVDTWLGDDWFHNGAFRQMMMDYIHDQEASRNSDILWKGGVYDNYDLYLRAGSAGELGRRMKMEHLDMWRKLLQHPSYDAFWQAQAVDKILADQPLKVPILYVHGLWDQEDIYGAVAAYQAVEPKDRENNMNFLVMGPWAHSGSNGDGSSLGPLRFDGNTARYYRQTILLPFLNERLKAGAAKANTPPVLVYETGSNDWKRFDSWPRSCESGCAGKMRPLFLGKGFGLGFNTPDVIGDAFDEYISDPSKPVPYRLRPIRPTYAEDSSWERWLVDDQRNFSSRTDVLSYQSEALTRPVAIGGRPVANLFASTTGTDSDFVLKLIDVYPDEYPSQPELGGYQLMISAEILRGRYRGDKAKPAPIPAGQVELFRWELPPAHHVFLPGHKIMVQIQSAWFPLYDRNPQTYVENIFWAKPADFIKATQRIYRAGDHASFIALPIMP